MPKKGDHLKVSRGAYTHHGLYLGNGKVIHYSGKVISSSSSSGSSSQVEEISLDEFCNESKYLVVDHPHRKYSPKKSIQRARKRLGEERYNIYWNNCEHFVNTCVDGAHASSQVKIGTAAILLATDVGLAVKAVKEHKA